MWYTRLLIFLGGFFVISIIGFIRCLMDIDHIHQEKKFLVEYRERFVRNGHKQEGDDYTFLFIHLDKAQMLLGACGVFARVQFPFEQGFHRDVPALTLLRHVLDGSVPGVGKHIDEAFIRAIGVRDEKINEIGRRGRNIFSDFYMGFNLLIMLPFVIMSYMFFGENRLSKHKVIAKTFSVVAIVIQLLAVLSGIVTVVVGWNDFIRIISRLLK